VCICKHYRRNNKHLTPNIFTLKKIFCTILFAAAIANATQAQITLVKGDFKMEIGGVLSSYINKRWLNPGETNQSLNKDRFKLRDARFYIGGEIGKNYEFKLQADLGAIGATTFDPEAPALYDANVTYKGIKTVKIILGYGKVPYSRASLLPFSKSAYWQRAEAFRGDFFARRDVGISIVKSFWQKRILATAGVYTGTGEVFYQGDNDPSGAYEYMGRLEASYPKPYKNREIDDEVSDKLNVTAGVNVRYSNRSLPSGTSFISGETGAYGLKVINGERYGLGADASIAYKGFSASIETQTFRGRPQNANDPFLRGLPKYTTNGYFQFGGWVAQANYFNKKIKTILSVRYDEMDLNDLVPGNAHRFSAAAAYQLNGYKSMIKAQFFDLLQAESIDLQRSTYQFRIGWQFALD
jgi:hypothetical protein